MNGWSREVEIAMNAAIFQRASSCSPNSKPSWKNLSRKGIMASSKRRASYWVFFENLWSFRGRDFAS